MTYTYKQILERGMMADLSGVHNPHAFKWQRVEGSGTEVYYPVDFSVLRLCVYKFPLGECTNGGVSSKSDTVYIPCDSGPTSALKLGEDQKLVLMPELRGGEYWALAPAYTPPHLVGPMSGGNLAYSCDSRCRRVYHIHDRFETQEMYDRLSR